MSASRRHGDSHGVHCDIAAVGTGCTPWDGPPPWPLPHDPPDFVPVRASTASSNGSRPWPLPQRHRDFVPKRASTASSGGSQPPWLPQHPRWMQTVSVAPMPMSTIEGRGIQVASARCDANVLWERPWPRCPWPHAPLPRIVAFVEPSPDRQMRQGLRCEPRPQMRRRPTMARHAPDPVWSSCCRPGFTTRRSPTSLDATPPRTAPASRVVTAPETTLCRCRQRSAA